MASFFLNCAVSRHLWGESKPPRIFWGTVIFPVILFWSFWSSFLFLDVGAAEGSWGRREHRNNRCVGSIAAAGGKGSWWASHILPISTSLGQNYGLIPVKCTILRMRQKWNARTASEWHICSGAFSSFSASPPSSPSPSLPFSHLLLVFYMLACWFPGDNAISSSKSSSLQPIIQHEAQNIIYMWLKAWNNVKWVTYLIINGSYAVAQAIPFDFKMHLSASLCCLDAPSFPWRRAQSSCSAFPRAATQQPSPTICCLSLWHFCLLFSQIACSETS